MMRLFKGRMIWKKAVPLLLAFEFAMSPIIFGSRGFDLPHLGSSVPSIHCASQDQSPFVSVFLAHHKRASGRVSVHKSFAVLPSLSISAAAANVFPMARDLLFLKSFCLVRLYRPPAVFPA